VAGRGETKRRILETASELFRRRGYHGTGLTQVIDESGAPRGSLYFHFPGGKQQLAVSAVDASGRAIGRGIEYLLDSGEDVGEAIARVVEFVAADLRDSRWERGCPVGTVAMDATLTSEPIRAVCSEIFSEWVGFVERRLVATGWNATEAREQALLAVSAIEGALMLAKAQRDTEPLDAVARQLRASLSTSKHRQPPPRPKNDRRPR
jgi:TetR/AcrR family transcriptional regulator, lmrAB and yxaGH operons repressor